MKIQKILILLMFLFASNTFFAQTEKTVNYKELSYEDALRIFGSLDKKEFYKPNGEVSRLKSIIIKGNKIATKLYNYGSVCAPNVLANVEDLVWNGLGYGFEFGTLAGAEVFDKEGNPLHIISDSHILHSQGDYSPDNKLKWGWLPMEGFADPNQTKVASLNARDDDYDGKPDSWPQEWYSKGSGKYLWPAFLGDMATTPDEEVFYGIEDYTNYEFQGRYDPFENDLTKSGLGLQGLVRIFQFNNPLAEDIIFMVYQMTNTSEKDLNKFYMGMFGDPHVGGKNDYRDDKAFFIPPKGKFAANYDQRTRSMVYAWDEDFKGDGGRKPGYFGWKFLESPSIDNDAIDNDDNGLIDESPFNSKGIYIDGKVVDINTGINNVEKYTALYGKPKPRWSGDEDGDWDSEKHDVGIDGIGIESPNYPGKDYGEGDGVPSQAWYQDINENGKLDEEEKGTLTDEWELGLKWAGSEPNFGFRDVTESDQIGLTGFTAATYGEPNLPKNDELLWGWFIKHESRPPDEPIDQDQPLLKGAGDNVFCFSTGPLTLKKGEGQRFSMAILMGEDILDLRLNAITSVKILEADYRFAQPPIKPVVRAVPSDGKVTLYWNSKSEKSVDPFTGEEDFEGYKIYRSRDYNFADVYKITDANGVPFLGQALIDTKTGKKAQWDLINEYKGLAPKEYEGRGVRYDLGANTGLVHKYVDSSVTNGIKYYYAVVAYDRGTEDLPPTETQAVIQEDPLTGKLIYDVNTASAVPGVLGKGIINAVAGINGRPLQIKGVATGIVNVEVLEDLIVENKLYKIEFAKENNRKIFNVIDSSGVSYNFTSKGEIIVTLRHKNIIEKSIKVFDLGGNLISSENYEVNAAKGQIGGKTKDSLPEGEVFKIHYRYYPIYKSTKLNRTIYDKKDVYQINSIEKNDGNDAFDGIKIDVTDFKLGLDKLNSTFIKGEPTLKAEASYPAAIGSNPVIIKSDFEVRWLDTKTDENGKWINHETENTPIGNFIAPFTIVNPATEEKAKYIIGDENKNKQWDFGEPIVLRPFDATPTDFRTSYQIVFTKDTTGKELIMPKKGDVYLLKVAKPFENDQYLLKTEKIKTSKTKMAKAVDEIYVVPNPYVGYSLSENPGRTLTKRGERELQFRNLPPKCTIRIYTITGELVDKIEKDDNSSIATWNLLSKEGMRIAYGVYIYHIEIPDVGEKIGKFAVIK